MADDRREALLVANRLSQLAESPIRGNFDLAHLQAVHAHIFQDLPQHRPGELRGDTSSWSKFRALESQFGVHEVHYAHDNIGRRGNAVLSDLGGPNGLATLPPDTVPARLARLYGDLDFVHPFHEGNSRTLREFTRSLAQAAGHDLAWASTNVDAAERNRLYVARDIAVLERAFPGLTPERGMQTNDRAEYEASLALPGLRRVPGASLEAIIRAALAPLPAVAAEAGLPAKETAPAGIAERALAALARSRDAAADPGPTIPHTPLADRLQRTPPASPAEAHEVGTSSPSADAKPGRLRHRRSDPEPSF